MINILPIFYLIAFTLLFYRIARSAKAKELIPLAILIVAGAILALYQGSNALLFVSILIVFDLVSLTYSSKEGFFMAILGILFLLIGSQTFSINIVAQAMLFGLIAEFGKIKFNKHSQSNKKVETNRDIVQMAIGVILLALFFSLKTSYAEFSILMLIMLGYLAVNYGATNGKARLSRLMKTLERDFTKLGQGAAWLSLGAIATIAFVFDVRYIAIIFFAIFIGDALATIIGIRFGKYKLPYNKKKSAAGSIAYFASVAILPYLLYGIFAIPLAIFATIAETLPIKLDDNFSVPAVLIIIYLIFEVIY
ncbi:MAG: diacylglycerol/polyprenol kinase family protein [Candidatus Micrarchaeales archaeon]